MKAEQVAMGLFAGAARARDLYPAGHPARTQAVAALLQALRPTWSKRSSAVFGIVEETLVFEDEPLYELTPALDELVKLLLSLEVKAVHLRKDSLPADVEKLFDILYSKQALEQKGPWIAKVIESGTGGRISVIPETPDATQVYSNAISYMGDLLGELRMGQIPRPEKAMNIAKNVTECVLKNEQAILGLTMIKSYDNYLFNHSVNVCVLSLALAKAAGIQEPALSEVGLGALLHDVGKTRIPWEVLSKPGKLSPSEWEIMKTHSTHSFEIIQEMGKMQEVTSRCAREHHVQFDHRGYPDLGLGKKAHPLAHLVAVADCYDAITTLRTYQNQTAPFEALKIMDRLAGTKLDPGLFETFVSMLGLYPPGSVVRLDSNEICVVIENRAEAPNEPKVKVIFDARGNMLPEPLDLDLASQPAPARKIVSTIDPVLRNINVGKYLEAVQPPGTTR